MKIRALKPFVSGIYTAERGETLSVPEAEAAKLVKYGLAEPSGDALCAQNLPPNRPEKGTGGETPAPAKKTARSAKSGAKKQCRAGA